MTIFRDVFVNILFTTVIIAYYFSIECNGFNVSEPNKTISRLRRQSNCGNSTFQCDDGQCVSQKKLCDGCGKVIRKAAPLIISGEETKTGSFPWHVGIYRKMKSGTINYICGGSIIRTNVVLSTAICFTSNDLGILNDKNEYYIAAGKYYRAYDNPMDYLAQKAKPKDIVIPANYRGAATNYKSDIAIVVLETSFRITHVVQPVCVDWQNEFEDTQLKSHNNGIVVGWGLADDDQKGDHELGQLEVPYISQADCFNIIPKSFNTYLTQDKFCAGYINATSIRKGNAGAGLVFYKSDSDRYYIRGLASICPTEGGDCDKKPVLYTRISMFMNTINKTVSENSY